VSGDLTVDTSTLKVDSTNNRVGIGTASPQVALTVSNNGSAAHACRLYDTGANASYLALTASNTDTALIASGTSAVPMDFYTGGSVRMRIDASGNVGIGVTPSNAAVGTYGKNIEIGAVGNTIRANGSSNMVIAANAYFDATDSRWEYAWANLASRYDQADGVHRWFIAPSGTAGNAITFTQAMTLDASGNLGVGTTSPNVGSWGRALTIQGASNAAYEVTEGTVRAAVFASGGTIGGLSVETNHPLGFYTNGTERARITSGGYFKASDAGTYVNSTGTFHEFRQTANSEGLQVDATNASYSNTVFQARATRNTTDNSYYYISCFNDGASNYRMRVADSGNLTNVNGTYGTISDIKHKQDVIDAPSQWDDLKAVRFRKFRMKSDVEAQGDDAPYLLGVVAQELAEVSPGLVEAHPDTERVEVTDEDGNVTTETRPTGTETLSVKSSILLMKAAVALQEAMARIEALEARLEALEA
jgi:hypothetical protein